MNLTRRKTIFAITLCLFVLVSVTSGEVSANSYLPFLDQYQGGSIDKIEKKRIGTFANNIGKSLSSNANDISFIFNAIFAIMFLIGVIKMSYALITKTGMVLKGSTGILIGIPIVVVLIRLFFILSFTTNGPNATLFISNLLLFFIKSSFFAAVGMVLVGLLMKLFHKFLNHPEYARWSKTLIMGAGILSLVTAIMPTVLQGI